MSDNRKLPKPSGKAEIDAFLAKVAATPPRATAAGRGRLVFALDATASRQPTWDHAAQLQGEMFAAAAGLGGLEVQLAWYRGFLEFEASPWYADGSDLLARMSEVSCRAGQTQVARVLGHVVAEQGRGRVHAAVFVGDCVEESPEELYGLAGRLGVLGVPLFMFLEGDDPLAHRVFAEVARLSGGACCRFDAGSAAQLRALLGAVAVYASGGRRALEDLGRREGGAVLRLTRQLGGR